MTDNKQNKHPSRVIDIPNWGPAEIDELMIPAVMELNKIGLTTRQCCAGDDKWDRYLTLDLKGLSIEKRGDDGPNGTITLRWNPSS